MSFESRVQPTASQRYGNRLHLPKDGPSLEATPPRRVGGTHGPSHNGASARFRTCSFLARKPHYEIQVLRGKKTPHLKVNLKQSMLEAHCSTKAGPLSLRLGTRLTS